MENQYLSNVAIDLFVEKLSEHGVEPEDISDYLHRSVQYQLADDFSEKMEIMDNLFFDLKCKYPDLSELLYDDINDVYFSNRFDPDCGTGPIIPDSYDLVSDPDHIILNSDEEFIDDDFEDEE